MAAIAEMTQTYKCDECEATFKGTEVAQVLVSDNIKMIPLHKSIMFVDKEGVVRGGTPEWSKGDKVMCCPVCGQVHLFGFDIVKDEGGK